MKTLNVTPITDTARMPIKKGTLQFLQDAHIENVSDIMSALRGTNVYSLNPVVLWGCVNSGSGLTYNISEGAVIFLGTIYKVDAAAFTASFGQTAVFNVVLTQYTTDADPVTFTDSNNYNVHDIRKIAISAGTSGLYDYSNFEFYNFYTGAATESRKGVAEIATTSETNAGTDDERFVTPLKLNGRTATESRTGIAEIATQTEVNAGTDDDRIVTSLKIKTSPEVMGVDGSLKLRTKLIDIGDWNMDSTPQVTVAHGISDFKKIVSVSVVVRNDADNNYYSPVGQADATTGLNLGCSIDGYTSSNILISRIAGGFFDNSSFDSTSYNRGTISVLYKG